MIRLSVIVPVFRVEQYLPQCLQSLSEQGLADYEVILIDDASPDGSHRICEAWCAEHPECRLVTHASNLGLSEARNTGLREARGEWVTFVDSDDMLEAHTLARVMREATDDVDVVEYPLMEGYGTRDARLCRFEPRTMPFREWMLRGGHTHCYACNKVFRRSLWQDMAFPPGRHYEDIFTIPHVLRHARLIRQTDSGCYYYYYREGSICRTMAEQTMLDYLEAYDRMLAMPESEGCHDMYLRAVNGETTYRRTFKAGRAPLIKRRHLPFSFAFSRGLSLHDRLKILWIAATHHG